MQNIKNKGNKKIVYFGFIALAVVTIMGCSNNLPTTDNGQTKDNSQVSAGTETNREVENTSANSEKSEPITGTDEGIGESGAEAPEKPDFAGESGEEASEKPDFAGSEPETTTSTTPVTEEYDESDERPDDFGAQTSYEETDLNNEEDTSESSFSTSYPVGKKKFNSETGKEYFILEDGSIAKGQFVVNEKGRLFYCLDNGDVAYGIIKIEGNRYLTDETGRILIHKIGKWDGNSYYCQNDGTICINKVITYQGVIYRADKTGKLTKMN